MPWRTAPSTCASSPAESATSENAEMAQLLRAKSKVLVAFGSCACEGCIPGLANLGNGGRALRCRATRGPGSTTREHLVPQPEWHIAGRGNRERRAAPSGVQPAAHHAGPDRCRRLLHAGLSARVGAGGRGAQARHRRPGRNGRAPAGRLGDRRRDQHLLRRVRARSEPEEDRSLRAHHGPRARSIRGSASSSRGCPATALPPATAAARSARPQARRASAAMDPPMASSTTGRG